MSLDMYQGTEVTRQRTILTETLDYLRLKGIYSTDL
jgi:hypothetical protein